MESSQRVRQVLALTDGRAGHETQTRGIVQGLAEEFAINVHWLSVRKPTRLWRLISKWLLTVGQAQVGLRWFGVPQAALPAQIDLVVSAGGDTLLPNALLAQYYDCQNVIASSLRGLAPRHFSAVFSLDLAQTDAPFIAYPVSPNRMLFDEDRQQQQAAKARLGLADHQQVVTVLIGAQTKHVQIGPVDWYAQTVKALQVKNNTILLTTSRRTPQAFEQALQASIHPQQHDHFTWVQAGEQCSIQDYIYAAEWVVCSPDSESMIGEAVSAGRLVVIPQTEQMTDSAYARFIQQLIARGWIVQQATVDGTDLSHSAGNQTSVQQALTKGLRQRLNW